MSMIDISGKKNVEREAMATGKIRLRRKTIDEIKKGKIKKGDPIKVAEVAGMLAVKNTSSSIPHCHPLPIESINFDFFVDEDAIEVKCRVKANYKTGVEMEALHGVAIALLTIWDMVKYLEKDEEGQYPYTAIEEIKVLEKVKNEP